jgi:hypothetical protein
MTPQEQQVLDAELVRAKEAYEYEQAKNDSRSYAYLQYLEGRVTGLEWVKNHLEFYAKDLAEVKPL